MRVRPPFDPKAPVRAAIYCRISSDREGRETGVERQEADSRAVCERSGYEVVEVFVENDTGASTRSRKPRPLYAELIEGARLGRWQIIVAYSTSRLTRRPLESEALITLFESRGTQFAYAVSSKFDLSTADGRMMARIAASIDAAEAERTAERVKDSKAQAAVQGLYRGGRRPYGYRKDGTTIRPSEAAVIREATSAVLAGRSLTAVAAELNDRGLHTSTGNTWTYTLLRDVLIRPRNAGLIGAAKGEIVGPAQWEAIVDEDTWRAVHSLLSDQARRTQKGTEIRWLGAGLYRCGRCGSAMRAVTYGEKFHYKCSESAHLTVLAVKTDEFVKATVVDLVRDPRVVKAMTPTDDGGHLVVDRERRAVLATRLASFEHDYADRLITGSQLAKATARVNKELAEVDARLAAGMQKSTSSPILNAVDPGAAFLSSPIDIQRAVLAACLVVTVLPRPKDEQGKAWSPDRLRLAPVAQ